MTRLFRMPGPLLLAGVLALGLAGCGRKGPLEPPPYAAIPPVPETAAVPGALGIGAKATVGNVQPFPATPLYGQEGNTDWNPTADRTAGVNTGINAGVNGATTRETVNAPAARERSVLDWLVD